MAESFRKTSLLSKSTNLAAFVFMMSPNLLRFVYFTDVFDVYILWDM